MEPLFSAARFLFDVEPFLYAVWFFLSICSKVRCRLLHLRHICLEHVWPLKNGCKQLKHSPRRLAGCLGCNLRNLSHLKSLCDSLHRGHCNCVATLQYIGLLTLAPAGHGDSGGEITYLMTVHSGVTLASCFQEGD